MNNVKVLYSLNKTLLHSVRFEFKNVVGTIHIEQLSKKSLIESENSFTSSKSLDTILIMYKSIRRHGCIFPPLVYKGSLTPKN